MNNANRKPFTQIACSNDFVGKIVLAGIYGGAICSHWKIASIVDGDCTLVPVEAVSFVNPDGTHSHRYVEV